jgi:hypothetical protein
VNVAGIFVDATTRSLVVDNTLYPGTAGSANPTGLDTAEIGAFNGSTLFTGQIDFCLAFDRALAQSELRALFANPYAFIARPRDFSTASIAGGSTVDLAGSSSGSCTGSGLLSVTKPLSGSTNGNATGSGGLTITKNLAGSSAGTSSGSGSLTVDPAIPETVDLAGSTAGSCTGSGALTIIKPLSGSSSGSSSGSGTLTVTGLATIATCKVTGIAAAVTLQAKGTDGEWRDLAEGDEIETGEEILAEASGAQFALTAYTLQNRVAGVWTNALAITLDLPSGTSHYRQDRFGITGDDTDNTVSILVTVERGDLMLRDLNVALEAQARNRFTYAGQRYKGMSDDIEFTTTFETGGQEPSFNGTILAPKRQFNGVAPVTGQKLTAWNGKTYRIDRVTEDEISYALTLESPNRK